MGLQVILFVHQSEDVVFDDLSALNAELAKKTPVGELVDFYNNPTPIGFSGWLSQAANGTVLVSVGEEHEFQGYEESTEVWACFDADVAKRIAKHMTAGKLVFRLEIEGNEDKYYVLTPQKMEQKASPKVSF